MILYKKSLTNNAKTRKSRQLNISIDEVLEFSVPQFKSDKDKVKYIKKCESIIRKSIEYKNYIKFLKNSLDMNKCLVLKNLKNGDGKRYSIEIHHEPFTLFDIVSIVLNKRIQEGLSMHELDIADEVMQLHYENKIGLIPLSVTMHEALHADKIFVPLQLIYQRYDEFFNTYEQYIESRLIKKIDAKVKLSFEHTGIASNSIEPIFTYVNIDGFNFPEVPEEWESALQQPKIGGS